MRIEQTRTEMKQQLPSLSEGKSGKKPVSNAQSLLETEKLRQELKENYKNIHFDFISFSNPKQMKQYAASQSGLSNVAISPKLLEKMASDEAVRAKVEHVLNSLDNYRLTSQLEALLMDKRLTGMGIVLDENGEVSKWTTMKETKKDSFSLLAKQSNDSYLFSKTQKESKNSYSTPYKYSQSFNMMRLAGAQNVSAVRGLIASKRAEIGKVKLQVSDPVEAAAIIRKIKTVISKGNIKIARLHREERIHQEKKAAAKKLKHKLEKQLEEELRKKKIARKAEEHCQTASFDDIFVTPSLNDQRFKQIVEQYAQTVASAVPVSSGMSGSVQTSSEGTSTVTVTSINCSV